MNPNTNRRTIHRRYTDRRAAALLRLHELIFYESDRITMNRMLMDELCENYCVDRCALFVPHANATDTLIAQCTSSLFTEEQRTISGSGVAQIIAIHDEVEGALTLSKFRKTQAFRGTDWRQMWQTEFGTPTSALLSVPVTPNNAPKRYLLLFVNTDSREWNSHDRDLAEEIAHLLGHIVDRDMIATTP